MDITPLEAWIAHRIGLTGTALTRADLTHYQLAMLNHTLAWARSRSPFYRQHLANTPSVLTTLAELTQIPFTTSDELRNHPLQFVCVSQDEIHRVVTLETSGTTGKPKRLYFTAEDQERIIDFFQVGMSTFTASDDRVLILLPGTTPGSVGDLLAIALGRLGAVPIKHGLVQDPAVTLDTMRRENINVIVGVPTQVLALARQSVQPMPKIKRVLLTTDHVPDAIKQAVERAWDCTVYNHYGMTEMGLGGGVECTARRGYHLREADLLFEVINPVTGEILPDGDTGEIVFTTLTRRGMPLIRYRTGDAGRFIPAACSCGTNLKTLAKVTHRLQARRLIGNTSWTMADLDERLFPIEGVLNFTAAVSHVNGRDCLQLEVLTRGNEAEQIPAIRYALPSDPDVDLHITLVSTLASQAPKRFIVEQRKHS